MFTVLLNLKTVNFRFLLIFLLISVNLLAQSSRRYYPSLSNIFLNQEFEGFPLELGFMKDWCRHSADYMFYRDLQNSHDPSGAASFNQLELIVKKNYMFEFFGTDLKISFEKNLKEKLYTTSILSNFEWRVKAYYSNFTFQDFDPEDNGMNFLYIKLIAGVSNNEVLSNFINRYIPFDYYSKKSYKEIKYLQTINAKNNIHVDTTTVFANICDSIRVAMPHADCNYSAYVAFLKDKDPIKTRDNIADFFLAYNSLDVPDLLDDYLLPKGNIQFLDSNVSILLPAKYFKLVEKQNDKPVSFRLSNIEYNLQYDFIKSSYFIKIKLEAHPSTLVNDFKFKFKYYNVEKDKVEHLASIITKSTFSALEVNLYPDYYTLQIICQPDPSDKNGTDNYEFYKKVKINK